MTLTEFQEILKDTTVSTEQFLRVHCCIEELFRRLLLIGLRLKGVQFKESAAISVIYYSNKRIETMEMILKYCGIDYKEMRKFRNFEILQTLYLQFTSRHRNRLMHGEALTYSDKELLELLISVDKSFIGEIQAYLTSISKPSIFDTPAKWGAKKGIKADIKKVYRDLFGKDMKPQPEYDRKKALSIMKKLKK